MNAESFFLNRESDKGRRFVAGLFWHPLSAATDKTRRREVQDISAQLTLDLVIWRTGDAVQAGLASGQDLAGACSSAAVISKTLDVESGATDFVCATSIPDGRWLYVAQKDGVILPDGDIIGNEDEIRARMMSDLSVAEFAVIIAPEHWGFSSSTEREFISFLPKRKGKVAWHKWWQLTPVRVGLSSLLKKSLPFFVLFALLLAGMFGFNYWKSWQSEKDAEAARIAAQAAAAQASSVVVKPWSLTGRATAWAAECMPAVLSTRVDVAGWTLSSVECGADKIVKEWKMPDTGGARVPFVTQLPEAGMLADGRSATLEAPVKHAPGTAEPLQAVYRVVSELADKTGLMGSPIKISGSTTPAAGAGSADQWSTYSWSLSTQLSPFKVIEAIDTPGLRVSRITLKKDLWTIEGVLYAN